MKLNWIRESDTLFLGKEIAYYEEVDSTNTRLKIWAKEDAAEGSLVIAEEQSQGKGRLGRLWESPKGTGIWMSVLVKPQIGIEKIPQITLLAGLATCEAIRKTTGLEAMIKWPNDIVVNNKKVCGILCELVNMGTDPAVVIGIGINVNSKKFPDDLPYATSLYLEGKEIYMREPIIRCLLEQLEGYYIQYKKQLSLHNIIDQYRDKCINMKREVNIVSNTDSYRATVKDIDVDGRLIVQKQNGTEETILAGEVSVRGLYGYI